MAAVFPPGEDCAFLHDEAEVLHVADLVASTARRRLIGFCDNVPHAEQFFAAEGETYRDAVRHPCAVAELIQITVERSALDCSSLASILQRPAHSHVRYRALDRLPFTLLVADTRYALIDTGTYDESAAGSCLVRVPSLVLGLTALADTLWNLALPAHGPGGPLDATTNRILYLLTQGATDNDIAADTGLSRRTVERRVHALFGHLGVTTRFQAGAQASRRGWI